jgi:hypothetical protein
VLRMLVLALLLANAAYFAWAQGLLAAYGFVPDRQSEPERLAQQIRPEAMQLLPAGPAKASAELAAIPVATPAPPAAAAEAPATGPQCLQVGVFTEKQATLLRQRLRGSLPAGSWSFESSSDSVRWIIYMGKYVNKEAMNRKRLKLEQLGLSFEPPLSPLLHPGLSLGSFASKADADNALAQIASRGLRSAKVVPEQPELPTQRLRLPAVDAPLRAKLDALSPQFEGKALQPCQ